MSNAERRYTWVAVYIAAGFDFRGTWPGVADKGLLLCSSCLVRLSNVWDRKSFASL